MSAISISICMAAYNGSKYLRPQIESILNQLGPLDEFIVYDDCSTDNTVEILGDYERLRLVKGQKNKGIVNAFGSVLSTAKGNVLVLCDQDDIWYPNKIEVIRMFFEQSTSVGFLHNALVMNADGESTSLFFPEVMRGRLTVYRQFVKNNFIGCCFAFRRQVLDIALPIPSYVSMHDWWLGTTALMIGSVDYTENPLIIYRRHNNNASSLTRSSLIKVVLSRLKNLACIIVVLVRVFRK